MRPPRNWDAGQRWRPPRASLRSGDRRGPARGGCGQPPSRGGRRRSLRQPPGGGAIPTCTTHGLRRAPAVPRWRAPLLRVCLIQTDASV